MRAEGLLEARKPVGAQGQPGSHRVAAEAFDQPRFGDVDRGQRVAHVESRDRPRRPPQHPAVRPRRRERNHRPVQPFLEPGRHQANHARMPVRIEQAPGDLGRAGTVGHARGHRGLGLVDHRRLHGAALGVDRIQRPGQLPRPRRVVAQQAFDAQRHVFQAAGRVEPRRHRVADVRGRQGTRVPPRHLDQRLQPRRAPPGTQPPQPGRDQRAVAHVQRDQVGDGAHRHQVQQHGQVRLTVAKGTAAPEQRPQRQKHVEHHPHPGQRLGGKAAAGLVGVDDGVGVRELFAGQVMVGHHHLPAAGARGGDAGMAGDPMVDGQQQVRRQRRNLLHQRRRQAVAVHHAVGHRVDHVAGAEHPQPAHRHRAGGGAVAVEVGDHQDPVAVGDGLGQQPCRRLDAAHAGRRRQPGQPGPGLRGVGRAARGVHPAQQRRHAVGPVAGHLDRRAATDAAQRGHCASVSRGRRQKRQRWPRESR